MPYKITNFEYLKAELAKLGDDLSLPWQTYPCLEWQRGLCGAAGYKYGSVKIPGPDGPVGDKAHRTAYRLAKGPIPDGLHVCHHCDNPPCFRPIHLFAGNHADNNADRSRKGRNGDICGERNPRALMTAEAAAAIRRLHAIGHSATELAQTFKVSRGSVFAIVYGRTWKHLRPH